MVVCKIENLSIIRMLDESLRWVIANGQIDRAKQIIKNACKWNKKNYEEVLLKIGLGESLPGFDKKSTEMEPLRKSSSAQAQNGFQEAQGTVQKSQDLTVEVKHYNIMDIVRNKNIFRVSLIMWYTW